MPENTHEMREEKQADWAGYPKEWDSPAPGDHEYVLGVGRYRFGGSRLTERLPTLVEVLLSAASIVERKFSRALMTYELATTMIVSGSSSEIVTQKIRRV
jgi:hypothetical protein